MPRLPRFKPVRILYTYAVIIVTILVMAILWFIFSEIFNVIQAVGLTTATQFGSTSDIYTSADAFMGNLFHYFLPLMILGLAYWVYIYSERKGIRA